MHAQVNTATANDSNLWFARHKHSGGTQLRVICFPYAGGGASIFRDWVKTLNLPIELAAALLPGREGRMGEPAYSCIFKLSRELTRAMAAFWEMPFILYGHSMGALLAYTLCQELRQQGLPQPERLIVSGARPPHIPETKPLHHLEDDAFIGALRRFSGTPEAILENEELMGLFMPMLRADFALEETYEHVSRPLLDVPITAISGTQDQEVSPEEMAQWAQHSSREFDQHQIHGGHFFINSHRAENIDIIRSSVASHLVPAE